MGEGEQIFFVAFISPVHGFQDCGQQTVKDRCFQLKPVETNVIIITLKQSKQAKVYPCKEI